MLCSWKIDTTAARQQSDLLWNSACSPFERRSQITMNYITAICSPILVWNRVQFIIFWKRRPHLLTLSKHNGNRQCTHAFHPFTTVEIEYWIPIQRNKYYMDYMEHPNRLYDRPKLKIKFYNNMIFYLFQNGISGDVPQNYWSVEK